MYIFDSKLGPLMSHDFKIPTKCGKIEFVWKFHHIGVEWAVIVKWKQYSIVKSEVYRQNNFKNLYILKMQAHCISEKYFKDIKECRLHLTSDICAKILHLYSSHCSQRYICKIIYNYYKIWNGDRTVLFQHRNMITANQVENFAY